MTPEEFRRNGYKAIDWIASYLERAEEYPVMSQVSPGDIRRKLPPAAPESGEQFGAIMRDLDEIIMPGITHWQSPNFFAYFPSNRSAPSILGELLAAGIGVQGMLWVSSPAATELETHVMDWLADIMALPEAFKSSSTGGGVIQTTASNSTFCAVIAALYRATGGRSVEDGLGPGLIAYASSEAHSSIEKAIRLAGVGSANLRKIAVDDEHAMIPAALDAAIREDVAAGLRPAFVCATMGTTSSMAMDPLRAIGEVCREHGAWYHVDAAMAGNAMICPEFRKFGDGLELADSYVFNPHKWLLTNVDCSALFVANRQSLTSAMSLVPEYLRNPASESGEVIDYRDWQLELGRRFRALKLWFVLRAYGVSGLQEIIRRHAGLAAEFASWVESDPSFELAAPARLNLVCFRHTGGDEINQRILDRANASGKMFITHTKLDGKIALRMSIGQLDTQRRHVESAWAVIREAAAIP